MPSYNTRKRAAHPRRVQAALHEILNDSSIMPKVDCRDLVISISRIEFGTTVRDILVEFRGLWRTRQDWRQRHETYLQEARERNAETYIDLTDVFDFEIYTQIVSEELQKRLGLLYTPTIRRMSELGSA